MYCRVLQIDLSKFVKKIIFCRLVGPIIFFKFFGVQSYLEFSDNLERRLSRPVFQFCSTYCIILIRNWHFKKEIK